MEMMDKWYKLYNNSVKNIQNIIKYCIDNSIIYYIDVLNDNNPYMRQKANNIDIKQLLLNIKDPDYFRIILRKDYTLYELNKKYDEILEIGIRGIYINNNEYFIFIYCDKSIFDNINNKWKLIKM